GTAGERIARGHRRRTGGGGRGIRLGRRAGRQQADGEEGAKDLAVHSNTPLSDEMSRVAPQPRDAAARRATGAISAVNVARSREVERSTETLRICNADGSMGARRWVVGVAMGLPWCGQGD